jgi:hypothetical protein
MPDLPPLPVDVFDDAADDPLHESGNPWLAWCDGAALALDLAVLFLLAGTVLTTLGSLNNGASIADRLRFAVSYAGLFPPLLALGSTLIVGAAGIMFSDARRVMTTMGRVAVYTAGAISLLLVVASAARTVDMLAGHISPNGSVTSGDYIDRIGQAFTEATTLVVGAATCWLGIMVLHHDDRAPQNVDTSRGDERIEGDNADANWRAPSPPGRQP